MAEIISKELKAVVKILNEKLDKKDRVKVVGATTAAIAKAFGKKIVAMNKKDEKVPSKALKYYNKNIAGGGSTAKDKTSTKKKTTAKKKEKTERAPSMESRTQEMLKEGKSDEQIQAEFIKIYKGKGKDKKFALQRANKYINQEKRNLGMTTPKADKKDKKKDSKKKDSKKDKKGSKKSKKSKKGKK